VRPEVLIAFVVVSLRLNVAREIGGELPNRDAGAMAAADRVFEILDIAGLKKRIATGEIVRPSGAHRIPSRGILV